MHLAVYALPHLPTRYVLSPDCGLPSDESDRRFGALRPCGTLRIADDLIPALSRFTPLSDCQAYLVEDRWSARYITALLERTT